MKLGLSSKNKPVYFWIGTVLLVSIGMGIAGEFDAMLAWWMGIGLLLPPLLWAFKTPYVTLKTICSISFITQLITLPLFYLYRNKFIWGHVKPFNFTVLEAFPMLAKVSLFLLTLVLFFYWLYPIAVVGGAIPSPIKSNRQTITVKNHLNKYHAFVVGNNKNPVIFSLFIIILIAILIPLNLWSYSQGIGLTGVEPPRLPYKLSGILFYLTKYITPLVLGWLYLKTKRGWFLLLLYLTYAWIFGLCSVSKGAVMIVMLPVVVLAWIDKRRIMFLLASLGTIIGVSAVVHARTYIYIVNDGRSGSDTSVNLFTLVLNMFVDRDSDIWNFDFLLQYIGSILSRVEGFENLVMAQFYDPNAVSGAWGFILRMIWRGLTDFDTDLHAMQWQGNVLPDGFYNGGALLSNAVILGNADLWWIALSSIVSAIILVILEKSCNRLSYKYAAIKLISTPIIIFMSLIFFIDTGGSSIFVFPFLLIFFVSWLPPIFRLGARDV